MVDFRKTKIESLILENLLHDEHYCSLVGIFLKPEYFKEVSEKQIFFEIQKHIKEYNEAPSIASLVNIISNRTDLSQTIYDNCLDTLQRLGKEKSNDPEWLLSETEKWAKDQAVYNGIVESISILEGKDKKTLSQDYNRVLLQYNEMNHLVKNKSAPIMVYKDFETVDQVIRDLCASDINRIMIDDKALFKRLYNFIKTISPDLIDRVFYYRDKGSIFDIYDLENQIEKFYHLILAF